MNTLKSAADDVSSEARPNCKVGPWTKELALLRKLLLDTDLTEEIKWSAPCYTHGGRNILAISALKKSVALSFFRGAELADPDAVLRKPGENTRFARYKKFTSTKQINSLKKLIVRYVREAIELEKSGGKAVVDDAMPQHPDELTQKFGEDHNFRDALFALTRGRQRGYLLHFNSAKQSKTRAARIDRCMPKILKGKGWNER